MKSLLLEYLETEKGRELFRQCIERELKDEGLKGQLSKIELGVS